MHLGITYGSAMIEIIKPNEKESLLLYINGRCLYDDLDDEEMSEMLSKVFALTGKELYIRQKIRDTCAILAATLDGDLLGDWSTGAILDALSNLVQEASE